MSSTLYFFSSSSSSTPPPPLHPPHLYSILCPLPLPPPFPPPPSLPPPLPSTSVFCPPPLRLLTYLSFPYATDVTDVLSPKYYESCPTMDDSVSAQMCVNTCNDSCRPGQKCCSIGCSRTCQNVTLVPYYPIPLTCPPRAVAVALSPDNTSCIRDCQLNSQCSYRELCCTYGCSSSCQPGQMPARPCSELLRRLAGQTFEVMGRMDEARMSPVVDYVLRCDDMGLFRRVQEGEGVKWCVNALTGAPTSDLVLNTSDISCPCEFGVVAQHLSMHA